MSAVENASRISPFLWFDSNAEEAADFYISIFRNSRKVETLKRSVDDPSGPKGTVLTVDFELDGSRFTALNGGPSFKFNEAVSFVVNCDSQAEIDEYWSKLIEGGGCEIECGWLKDKFGLCWQVVPRQIKDMIKHPKAMQAMLRMKKMDLAELERAAQS